jgi:superfamily I DNA and RNA helicase
LIRKNNYDLDVFNGDIGKVTAIVKANILIDIEDFGGPRQISVPIEQAEDMLKLGYAITVHKAQGSEYDLVILPIVKAHGKRILQRNLFYTAITRAKQKVILFGQGAAVVDAIENDKIQERNTLFAERIRRWINGEGTSLQQLYSNAENYQNAKTLKRLLLSEEKASSALATTDSSYEEDQDYEKTSKETSKPVRQLSRSENMSLEKMLNEIGQLIEESEMESNPKENLDQIKGENPRSS